MLWERYHKPSLRKPPTSKLFKRSVLTYRLIVAKRNTLFLSKHKRFWILKLHKLLERPFCKRNYISLIDLLSEGKKIRSSRKEIDGIKEN